MQSTSSSPSRYFWQDYLTLFLISGAIIALDQITKALVRSNLALSQMWVPWDCLAHYARIVHWQNTGVAFGLLQGFGDVFAVLAFLVSFAILYYFPRVPREDWLLRLALCLQFAGAIGNLIDRLTIGYVLDFISIGPFPVFNFADLSITIGVVLLLISVWLKERAEKQASLAGDSEAPSESAPPARPAPPTEE